MTASSTTRPRPARASQTSRPERADVPGTLVDPPDLRPGDIVSLSLVVEPAVYLFIGHERGPSGRAVLLDPRGSFVRTAFSLWLRSREPRPAVQAAAGSW